ncbi:MAG: hypothetical protein BWZ11_00068 [Bacteroidetes bacterium ADurb.BinA395]|nr:MAG: hypothetical protein BWZ11_00068 [Bacteroidetes bacterium ADurb.BinA395]
MKKYYFFVFLFIFSYTVMFGQWNKISMEKASGGGGNNPCNLSDGS